MLLVWRSAGRGAARASAPARCTDSAEVVRLGGERAGGGVEVGDQALELLLAAAAARRRRRPGRRSGCERSCGSVPEQRLVDDRACRAPPSPPYSKESLIASAGGLALDVGVLAAVLGGGRLVVERGAVALAAASDRFSRSGACSVVRIWSSWTAVEVWVIGIVPPSDSSGALGLPGFTSRKKLPSRKMRGRISTWASSWIGRPASSTVKVTSAASPTLRTLDAPCRR